VSVAARITNEDPPGIAEGCALDPHVDGVLARALAKDPAKRFASTREFGYALAEALGRRSRGALPTLPDERHEVQWRAEPRAGARLLVGGAAAGALIGIAGIQVTSGLKDREQAALAEPTATATPAVAWLSDGPLARAQAAPTASVRKTAPNGSTPPPRASAPRASPRPSAAAPALDAGATNDGDAGQ
jgi:serine/threonine-protein kinase